MLLAGEPSIHLPLVDQREQLEQPLEVALLRDGADLRGEQVGERVDFLREQRGAENVVDEQRAILERHGRERRVGEPLDRAAIDPVHIVHRLDSNVLGGRTR